jgi:glutathione S-transferase
MAELTLVLGNKNYSSWSLRAWLALEQTGAAFREQQILFHEDADRAQRLRFSPAGKVPVLLDGDFAVWDSLAIAEHLAERFPNAGLWPKDARARSRARSVCSEMHSGFPALRSRLPMNCRARKAPRDRGPEVAAEVRRMADLWSATRGEFGSGGSYLFGARSIADAFFAPVASRFRTYGVTLDGVAGQYADAVLELPAVKRWMAAAESESARSEAFDAVE